MSLKSFELVSVVFQLFLNLLTTDAKSSFGMPPRKRQPLHFFGDQNVWHLQRQDSRGARVRAVLLSRTYWVSPFVQGGLKITSCGNKHAINEKEQTGTWFL